VGEPSGRRQLRESWLDLPRLAAHGGLADRTPTGTGRTTPPGDGCDLQRYLARFSQRCLAGTGTVILSVSRLTTGNVLEGFGSAVLMALDAGVTAAATLPGTRVVLVPVTAAEHVPELRHARPEGLPGAQVEQLRPTRTKHQALSLRAVWAARSSQSDQEGVEA